MLRKLALPFALLFVFLLLILTAVLVSSPETAIVLDKEGSEIGAATVEFRGLERGTPVRFNANSRGEIMLPAGMRQTSSAWMETQYPWGELGIESAEFCPEDKRITFPVGGGVSTGCTLSFGHLVTDGPIEVSVEPIVTGANPVRLIRAEITSSLFEHPPSQREGWALRFELPMWMGQTSITARLKSDGRITDGTEDIHLPKGTIIASESFNSDGQEREISLVPYGAARIVVLSPDKKPLDGVLRFESIGERLDIPTSAFERHVLMPSGTWQVSFTPAVVGQQTSAAMNRAWYTFGPSSLYLGPTQIVKVEYGIPTLEPATLRLMKLEAAQLSVKGIIYQLPEGILVGSLECFLESSQPVDLRMVGLIPGRDYRIRFSQPDRDELVFRVPEVPGPPIEIKL